MSKFWNFPLIFDFSNLGLLDLDFGTGLISEICLCVGVTSQEWLRSGSGLQLWRKGLWEKNLILLPGFCWGFYRKYSDVLQNTPVSSIWKESMCLLSQHIKSKSRPGLRNIGVTGLAQPPWPAASQTPSVRNNQDKSQQVSRPSMSSSDLDLTFTWHSPDHLTIISPSPDPYLNW